MSVDPIQAACGQIRSLRRQYENQKAENAAIEAKIAALENAKRIMSRALDRSGDLERKLGQFKVADRWEGRLGQQTETTRMGAKGSAGSVSSGIKQGIGEINGHIWNLRMQMNYLVKMMSSIEGSIYSLQREIARLQMQ